MGSRPRGDPVISVAFRSGSPLHRLTFDFGIIRFTGNRDYLWGGLLCTSPSGPHLLDPMWSRDRIRARTLTCYSVWVAVSRGHT